MSIRRRLKRLARSQPDDARHHFLGVAAVDHLVGGQALVEHEVEHFVGHGVLEAELALRGLAWPEVGRRPLGDDLLGYGEKTRQLPDLLLVKVADRVERARVVAEDRRVAEQDLALVRGAGDERAVLLRQVEEDRHALARHLVAAPHAVGPGVDAVEVGVDLRRDVDRRQGESQLPGHRRGVDRRLRIRSAVGEIESVHAIGADRADGERRGERRIDAAGQSEHEPGAAGVFDAIAQEVGERRDSEGFVQADSAGDFVLADHRRVQTLPAVALTRPTRCRCVRRPGSATASAGGRLRGDRSRP